MNAGSAGVVVMVDGCGGKENIQRSTFNDW
jgi:hypothetical protein